MSRVFNTDILSFLKVMVKLNMNDFQKISNDKNS